MGRGGGIKLWGGGGGKVHVGCGKLYGGSGAVLRAVGRGGGGGEG